jgi:hypothetical protein
LGGFISHLVDSRKPEASAATRRYNLGSFIDDLDELLFLDLPSPDRSKTRPFSTDCNSYHTRTRIGFKPI